MKTNGVFAMNLWGYYSGEKGRGIRSIYKTLQESGFQTYLRATGPDENESNLLMVCFRADCSPEIKAETLSKLKSIPIDIEQLIADAPVLTDDKPALDHLNQEAYKQFRTVYVAYYYSLRQFGKEPPVFY